MKRRTPLAILYLAMLVLNSPARAFDCMGMPGPIRERMPDPRDQRTAVFIGQVRRLSPEGATALVHITERFAGMLTGTEVQLECRHAECFRFTQGETYLVEAFRARPEEPWAASTCLHTRILRDASGDLVALRAWRNGRRTPCDVVGSLWGRDGSEQKSGIAVRLGGEALTLHAVTDREGRFLFKDAPNGTYAVTAGQPGWRSRSTITNSACPNADLFRL